MRLETIERNHLGEHGWQWQGGLGGEHEWGRMVFVVGSERRALGTSLLLLERRIDLSAKEEENASSSVG